MRYFMIVIACFTLALLVLNYAYAGEAGDGFNGVSFRPQLVYKTVDTSYTEWNQGWLLAAILGQTGDIVSTSYALNHGATEVNPLFGENPNLLLLIGVKAALVGGAWLLTEYVLADEEKQAVRNYVFAPITIFGFGATAWNMGQ